MMQLIVISAIFVIIIGGALYLFYLNSRKLPYNGLQWIHPDHGGGIKVIDRKEDGQNPFFIKYFWYSLSHRPIYCWYEDKVTDEKTGEITYPIKHWEPQVLPKFKKTPNELFDLTDWTCSARYLTVKDKLTEAVKLGMGIAMVAILVIGTMFVLDMVLKDNNTKPIQTAAPPKTSMYIPPRTGVNLL